MSVVDPTDHKAAFNQLGHAFDEAMRMYLTYVDKHGPDAIRHAAGQIAQTGIDPDTERLVVAAFRMFIAWNTVHVLGHSVQLELMQPISERGELN